MQSAGRNAPGVDDPIDDVDVSNLAALRRLEEAADPMPEGLVDKVTFALALEQMDAEVARLVEEATLEGVRAGPEVAEQARTIIFESSTVTVMVSITPLADGHVRIDGWLSPEGEYRIELRTAGEQLRTESDATGRFVVEMAQRGIFRLVLRAPKSRHNNAPVVITPSIVID